MTRVKVATKNRVKVMAVEKAFKRYFDKVGVKSNEVESDVPDQPINDDVFQGAKNRLEALKGNSDFDFIVSCEGGLISQGGHWFNVQVVMVEDKNGNHSVGISQGYEIPTQYVEEAIKTSVAEVLDRVFDGKGGIRVLTQNQMTREKLIEDGTVMALAKVLNSEVW